MVMVHPSGRADRFLCSPWSKTHAVWRALDERLAVDHLARQVASGVDRLDLTALVAAYGASGSSAHRPERLLMVVLYELHQGRHSPAQWCRDARECEPVRWLLAGAEPSRSCWYAFRDRVAPVLDEFNRQVLAQAQAQGITSAQSGALDGTSVAADAGRRRLVNEATLLRRLEQLEQVLDEAPTPVPAGVAPTPRGRRRQLSRWQQALEVLRQRQARNAGKRAGKRRPADKILLSLADPEATVSYDKEGIYRPLYNVQILDDLDSPLVLAYDVYAQPNDAGLLAPMLQRAQRLVGHGLQRLLADTAYAGGADVAAAEAAGVTLYAPLPAEPKTDGGHLPKSAFVWQSAAQTYRCPQGHRLVYEGASRQKRSGPEAVLLHCYRCPPRHCQACPLQARCTSAPQQGRTISRSEHEDKLLTLRTRMETPAAKDLYRQRRQTVELVNADWKGHRKLRRFSGRGLCRARAQVALLVLTHNLLTLSAASSKPKARRPA